MRKLTGTFAILLLVIALGVAACGGDDDDDAGGGTSATPTATADTGGDGGGDGATFVEVDAADFSFSPTEVSAEAGVELTFAIANTGDAPHTFNLYSDEDYTEPVEGGETGQMPSKTLGDFVITLDAGEYFFRCEIHPGQMQGTLTVE